MRPKDDPEPTNGKPIKKAYKNHFYILQLKLTCLFTGVCFSTFTIADSSANLSLSSNYLWRGITQNNDKIAASGGLDYSADSGFYIGTWASTLIGGSYELDLYGGFSKVVNKVSYDIGIINYQYPNENDYFNEVYLNLSYSGFALGIASTFDSKDNNCSEFSNGDLYLSLGYSYDFVSGIELAASIGHYDFDDDLGDDYNHYNISANKYDFTLAVDSTSGLEDNNDTTLTLAYTKTFEF
jgi:uncharacterized protein (TIGR02001 family)